MLAFPQIVATFAAAVPIRPEVRYMFFTNLGRKPSHGMTPSDYARRRRTDDGTLGPQQSRVQGNDSRGDPRRVEGDDRDRYDKKDCPGILRTRKWRHGSRFQKACGCNEASERRPAEASAALPESENDPIVAGPIAAAPMLTPSKMIASSPTPMVGLNNHMRLGGYS
jgi:hypothetical protein